MSAGIGSLLSAPAYVFGGPTFGWRGLTAGTALAGKRPVESIYLPVMGTKYSYLWRRNGTPAPATPGDFTNGDTFGTSSIQRSTPAGHWSAAGFPVKAPRQVIVAIESTTYPAAGSGNNYVDSFGGTGYNPSSLSDVMTAAGPAVNALGAELIIQRTTDSPTHRQWASEIPAFVPMTNSQFLIQYGNTFASPLSHPPAPLASADAVSADWPVAPASWWAGGECLMLAVVADVPGGSPRPLISVSFSGTNPDLTSLIADAASLEANGHTVRPTSAGKTFADFDTYNERNPGMWSYDLRVTTALASAWAAQYARWGRFALKYAYHSARPTHRWESLFPLAEIEPLHTLTGCEKLPAVSFTADADCAAWIVAQATAFFS